MGNEAALNFGTDPTSYAGDNPNAQIKARSVNAANNATDLAFTTWNGSAFGERLRIVNNGNVGIGLTNPGAMLAVNGGIIVDAGALDVGTASASYSLLFGPGSGEGIGSDRNTAHSDNNGLTFYTAFNKRLSILNNGNIGIGTTNATQLLTVNGGAYCNGTTWVNSSDRNAKQDFATVDPRTVLAKVEALPITEWQYKVETNGVKHLGPMAQDFHEAFGLNGSDDKHISTVDASGVALAAIQGLSAELKEQKAENAELKQRLADLEKLVRQMSAAK